MKVKKAVIPAAGFGTRMLPATKTVPKEMLPLVDRPVIQYIVEEAAAAGIEDILIITNRDKGAMEDYFDYRHEMEEKLLSSGKSALAGAVRRPAELANIFYTRQRTTSGLGHAVWCAKDFIGDEPFAVLLGDDVIDSKTPVIKQLIDEAEKYGAPCVGVKAVPDEEISKYSSLAVEPVSGAVMRVTDMIEKPGPGEVLSNYAILGRYVLTPDIFEILGKLEPGFGNEIQLTDGLKKLCFARELLALEFEGRRYDTGNLKGFLEATIEYSLKNGEVSDWLKKYIKEKSKTF